MSKYDSEIYNLQSKIRKNNEKLNHLESAKVNVGKYKNNVGGISKEKLIIDTINWNGETKKLPSNIADELKNKMKITKSKISDIQNRIQSEITRLKNLNSVYNESIVNYEDLNDLARGE